MSSALTELSYTTIKLDSQASYEEINEKLDAAVKFANDLYANCIYKKGDEISAGALTTDGYIVDSAQTIRFHVPLAHIPTSSSVSMTGTLYVRQFGKYHYGGGSTTTMSKGAITLKSSNTSCGLKKNGFGVSVSVSKMPDATTAHPCGIRVEDMVITFS